MKRKILFTVCVLLSVHLFAQKKPNVVFILADDLGYGDLGCYGQKSISTPSLDKLASEGMRFTQFYSGTSVCAPSRASFMTGLHTGHTPVRGNYEIRPEGQFPLPDSAFTMAELFKKAGYVTGAFGKWGLGYPGSEGEPTKQGFDRFFGYNCQRQSHNYFPGHLWQNTQRIALANTPANQVQYAPDLIQEKALTFLEENRQKPFFLYLAYTLPHAGLQLPAGDTIFNFYKKIFNEKPLTIPAEWNGIGYQPQAYPRSAYAALVSKLDAYVGQVLQKLQALGLEKNTLVVFTSDNGPHSEGGYQPHYFNSSGGLRGSKRDLYEGGIREPMIVRWPGVTRKGITSAYTGAAWDLLPTFAALTRQRLPRRTDGLSLLPLLTGKGKQPEHPFLYWEFHEDGGRQAVRMGEWKGVRMNIAKKPEAAVYLYNLAEDPAETTDVGTRHPDVLSRIKAVMDREHEENKDFPLLRKNENGRQ